MVSLVDGLNNPKLAFRGEAAPPVTEAEEAHAVLAIMVAFMLCGIASILHALSVAAIWP